MSTPHEYPYLILWRRRSQKLIMEAEEAAMARQLRMRRKPGRAAKSRMQSAPVPRLPEQWQVTAEEMTAQYPCDRLAQTPVRRLTRGIDVDAPADVAFRWLCQLRIAPYSYDWIDNLGRRSPRTLTPGADQLTAGQSIMIGEITDFAVDDHITGRAFPRAERLYGLIGLTYRVVPRSPTTSRLVVALVVHEPRAWWEVVRFRLLAWGDLIMMRKQLITLKTLAEQTAASRLSAHEANRSRLQADRR